MQAGKCSSYRRDFLRSAHLTGSKEGRETRENVPSKRASRGLRPWEARSSGRSLKRHFFLSGRVDPFRDTRPSGSKDSFSSSVTGSQHGVSVEGLSPLRYLVSTAFLCQGNLFLETSHSRDLETPLFPGGSAPSGNVGVARSLEGVATQEEKESPSDFVVLFKLCFDLVLKLLCL